VDAVDGHRRDDRDVYNGQADGAVVRTRELTEASGQLPKKKMFEYMRKCPPHWLLDPACVSV
jgi:hypothetical protein